MYFCLVIVYIKAVPTVIVIRQAGRLAVCNYQKVSSDQFSSNRVIYYNTVTDCPAPKQHTQLHLNYPRSQLWNHFFTTRTEASFTRDLTSMWTSYTACCHLYYFQVRLVLVLKRSIMIFKFYFSLGIFPVVFLGTISTNAILGFIFESVRWYRLRYFSIQIPVTKYQTLT